MATQSRFIAKNGLDNNSNSITNLGTSDNSLTMTGGAHAVTLTTTGATNVTLPTSGTLATVAQLPTVNNGTLTLAVSGTGLSGSASFTANQSGNSTFTVTSNATSANTASTIVARDASGNFSAGTITATSFNATSTQRVKTAIQNLGRSYLDKFAELKPREYDRTDIEAHEFGFVAEEMATVYPEIVARDEEGQSTGIDYSRLSAILTAKVQEQQSVIDKLQEQMAKVMELLKGSI